MAGAGAGVAERSEDRPARATIGPDCVGLSGVPAGELRRVLTRARELRRQPEPSLVGRTVATVFFEDSTRTRTSFAIAAQRLGAQVVDLSGKASSANKGETLLDTGRVIEAMGVSAIVLRTGEAGAAATLARELACGVVNAGDGRHEHPTQALADALALDDHWNGSDGSFGFAGKRVLIVGDVVSSRVARSNAAALKTLGAEVVLVGPPLMVPGTLGEALGCRVSHDLDAELPHADGVMMLRIQFERGAGALLGSAREFRAGWGLTADRAARLRSDAAVLHPGPTNRGVEIDPEVADSPRSLILRQVAAGVGVRMAVLEACAG
jgi:aspartate carbamoyltransferase catalytic subunit